MIKLIRQGSYGDWRCTYGLCSVIALLGEPETSDGACVKHILWLATKPSVLAGRSAIFIPNQIKKHEARHAIARLLRVISRGEIDIANDAI